MSTITNFTNLTEVAQHFQKDLVGDHRSMKDLVLLFAHNASGKTRLSMEFRQIGKTLDDEGNVTNRDTLYFNAFTEDLFNWDNDLDSDEHRVLILNKYSQFFVGIQDFDIVNKIRPILSSFSSFNFSIDFNYIKPNDAGKETPETHWAVRFIREELVNGVAQNIEKVKVSRGEENLFIWCFFLAIYQLAIDGAEGYDWVKYVYIDDPISSLDENNAIALACGLAAMLESGIYEEVEEAGVKKKVERDRKVKVVLSTHHSLFFNVISNEIGRKLKNKKYFLHNKGANGYSLQDTNDTPFFHHIATLNELKNIVDKQDDDNPPKIYTFHFNALRSILEKTATFFGYDKIDKCINGLDDEVLFARALQLFSHGKYSIFDPVEMGNDNKELFIRIFKGFTDKFDFYFPEIFNNDTQTEPAP
jgi:hypothetical protein